MLLIRRVTAGVILLLLAGCVVQSLPPASSTNPLELPPAGLPNGVAAGDVTGALAGPVSPQQSVSSLDRRHGS